MKKRIEKFLLKKNLFIISPRVHSFGGSIYFLGEAIKISNYKKYKKVLCVPFLFFHKKMFKKRFFSIPILIQLFREMSLLEKLISLILTVYVNFNLILKIIKVRGIIQKIFNSKFCDNYLPISIGYDGNDNNEYFQTSNEEWSSILNSKINFSQIQSSQDFFNKKNYISLYVKDENYNVVSEITNTSVADIEKYKKSLEFLLKKKFEIIRVGDNLSKKFIFKDDNYFDLTNSNFLNLKNQYVVYQNSKFYLGTAASGTFFPIFFDKIRIITNSDSYWANCGYSFNKKNFVIFKKVFSLKQRKILSIEEILNEPNLFLNEISKILYSKEYILIENDSDEIYYACQSFINYNFHNLKEDETLLDNYLDLKNNALDKVYDSNIEFRNFPTLTKYRQCVTNIPKFYLEKYLFNSDQLKEESEKVRSQIKL